MGFRIQDFTAETFLPYQGLRFLFQRPPDERGIPGDLVELDLLEVTPYGRASLPERDPRGRPPEGLREPFSLLFALRGERPLGKGLHRLVHDEFEPCDLFLSRVIVPGRGAGDGTVMYYEAVFG